MSAFNYVVTGARVIDPGTALDAVMDVAIEGKHIARISDKIDCNDPKFNSTTRVIRANGCIITPGWIDLHSHFYPDDYYGLMPNDSGVLSGCTSIVDAGSSGILTYNYFYKNYLKKSKSKAYAFLLHHPIGQFFQEEYWKDVSVNTSTTSNFIKKNKYIVGLKDKITAEFAYYQGVEGVRRAIDIANQSKKIYAAHIGTHLKLNTQNNNISTDLIENSIRACTFELLASLRKGDIIFHAFTGKLGGIFTTDGRYDRAVEAALKRGVLLDASPGRGNFDLNAYTIARNRGIVPNIISSDLVQYGLTDVVFNMGAILSRFNALDISLSDVIAKATIHPSLAANLHNGAGLLIEGGLADVTIADIEEGNYTYIDKINGVKFHGTKLISPRLCFIDGLPYSSFHRGLNGTSPWRENTLPSLDFH
jgi:dihydroorotase